MRDLRLEDWRLEVLDTWQSEESGGEYPAGWRITIPSLELELEGRPLMPNQELNVSSTYWEGAVSFSGSIGDMPLTAKGYIEMTGYAGSMNGRL
jgi:predicted secreted hydrolase